MSDNGLDDVFQSSQHGFQLFELLRSPQTTQIAANRHDRVFYDDARGTHMVDRQFPHPQDYIAWVNEVLALTDAGYEGIDVARVHQPTVEGSFNPLVTELRGSVHVCTPEITGGQPVVTIRKQPNQIITLERMVEDGMLSQDMSLFLQRAVRGRLNILISGSSGAGKTALARALSWSIDPSHRVVSCEDIAELRLPDRLANAVQLLTHREVDPSGAETRNVTLSDLVWEALRMRAHRIWVGEVIGPSAVALVTACNSGHDGSVTTIHADSGQQAVKQLRHYLERAGSPPESAREEIATAFHLVVHVGRGYMHRRVVTEITELEPKYEGRSEQSRNPLYWYDMARNQFIVGEEPTQRLIQTLARNGVNYDDGNGYPGRDYGTPTI